MGRAPGAITRHGRWQYLLLAAGLFLFALLVYAADPRVVLRTFTHLGWLTPLLALPYFTSYAVDSIGWWWVLSHRLGQRDGAWKAPNLLQLFGIRAAGEAVNAITLDLSGFL